MNRLQPFNKVIVVYFPIIIAQINLFGVYIASISLVSSFEM